MSDPVEPAVRDMTSHPDETLRAILRTRAAAARRRLLDNGGAIPADELDELERLSRLIQVSELAEPRAPRKRWPLAAALGATLAAVSILLFARVRQTDIELDLIASEVSFTVPTRQVLTELVDLSALGASGLSSIRLPPAGSPAMFVKARAGETVAIRVSTAVSGDRSGSINLAPVTLQPGTRVRVGSVAPAGQHRLTLDGTELDLQVAVLGPVQIGMAAAAIEELDFGRPRAIVLHSDSSEVDLDMSLTGDVPFAFTPLLDVRELSLFRVDDYPDRDASVVRRVSAIESGTLYLESLNGEERRLRSGQPLHFDDIDGQIRTLRLRDDGIALQLHGRVRGMRTGAGRTERSLMPTLLEWLHARHGASLLWGTTLYLFGLVVGVLRWWGART
jgi:hypothetical protein